MAPHRPAPAGLNFWFKSEPSAIDRVNFGFTSQRVPDASVNFGFDELRRTGSESNSDRLDRAARRDLVELRMAAQSSARSSVNFGFNPTRGFRVRVNSGWSTERPVAGSPNSKLKRPTGRRFFRTRSCRGS